MKKSISQVALIVGGARMGLAVGEALARRGHHVVLTYRQSRRAVESAVIALKQKGLSASALRCDLQKTPSIQSVLQQIQKRWGRLDVFVNLASIYEKNPLKPQSVERDWDENLSANARGGYVASVLAAPLMNRSGGGHIVHVSDWTAASGRPRYRDYAPYYVSKAAVKSMVEVLALELAPKILVNAIAPGPILPPPELNSGERKAVEKATPLGRWGGAEAIARAVLFLVETDFVTGETIRVDGGRHLL